MVNFICRVKVIDNHFGQSDIRNIVIDGKGSAQEQQAKE